MANRFVDPTKSTGTLTGTCSFTNGSDVVNGSGTSFTSELSAGDYIKPDSAGYNEWYKVKTVDSDTQLTLEYNFAQDSISGVSTLYNSEDGTSADHAFCHINQATVDEVRAAGDVIYLRRGQTYTYEATTIEFDEDGTYDNYITLRGDDGTGWSGEENLDRPIIDFGSSTNRFNVQADYYWKFHDLDIKGGSGSYGLFRAGGRNLRFYNCRFRDCTGGVYGAVFLFEGSGLIYFENCSWVGNSNNALKTREAMKVKLKGCSFDGNVNCISATKGSTVELEDCDFGVTTSNSGNDIYIGDPAIEVIGRNIKLNDTNKVSFGSECWASYVKIEDLDGEKDNHKTWYPEGTITRDTSVVRTGGADSSARVEPNSYCSSNQPLEMFEFKIWAPASQKTYSVYMRASGWTSLPTSSECYIEAEYYDQASGAHKATITSTQSFSANDEWTEFSVTVTPAQTGVLRLRGYLKKYESGAKVYVDVKPVIS